MRSFWILTRREFHGRISKRGYWIFTLVGLIVLIGLTFLPSMISWVNDKSKSTVLVNDPAGLIATSMLSDVHANPGTYHFVLKESDANTAHMSERQVASSLKKQHSHVVIDISGPSAAKAALTIKELGSVDPSLIANIEQLAQQEINASRMATLPPAEQAAIRKPISTHVIQLETGAKSNAQLWESRALVYYMLILLFATITIYGSWVAQGVVQEKSNRIIEMMLVTTKPWQILFGKIVGIGFVGLVQYAVWIVGAGTSLLVRKQLSTSAVAHLPIGTLALMPIFFIIGYILYATLYAIAASLVTRVEEQQMAITPVVMLMLLLFYTSLFAILPAPDSLFSTIASFVPIITPMAMFTRAALSVQSVPAWQILVSIILTLALNAVLVWYGARVYKRFALRNSGKSSWKLLWRRIDNQ